MVGGGQGAFIGAVHRIAARIDDQYEFCAGALSSDPERAVASAQELGLAPDRSYASFESLIDGESGREDGVEAVSIVTPNNVHYAVAKSCLEAGIHVICDKPMTVTSDEARELVELAASKNRILAVTYNYSGYPMIRQARAMVANGELGEIRLVQVEYPQDWLTEALEETGQKQAAWRTDPAQSGAGGCVGDIGTHAYHLAGFVSGLEASELCAELTTFVGGRAVDDNVHVLLRYANGARGMLWASQVAPGNENGLRLRIYGTKGGLGWCQEDPNYLSHTPFGEAPRRITRGGPGSGEAAAAVTRIPAGHPEGYLEGFATLYREIAEEIRAVRGGATTGAPFPRGEAGLQGVEFIEAAVRSSAAGAVWVNLNGCS
jgi:predicted dehydrogenase